MRSKVVLPLLSLIFFASRLTSAHIRDEAFLQRRDEPSSDGPSASTAASPSNFEFQSSLQPTPSGSSAPLFAGSISPTRSSGEHSTTTDGATDMTSAATASNAGPSTVSGIVVGPSVTPIANSTYNGTVTSDVHIDGLPIQPSITPAIAVAGAVLMISGVVHALIGVKTQRIHIFFSTAYLFSLAVTVLIEYVMHPPISNGVQAAYFVAACATGLVFGAVATIFADVTEGLGCFLGGFCLSMWFLVLKSGGLLTTTAGKAIFIACFTVGVFPLYISHYTRPYGIIGSTAFSGATATVLGIDCFSRAGLKEFWLYIWNLNDGIFPLNYVGPYPITRGIRVEIAAIVFLFILGVMSQMKVWKIVKKRREARAAEQRRKEEERDTAEEALGRRLEADNEQERAMWDAVYGGKVKGKGSHLDSGIGTDAPSSTHKSSISVREVEDLEQGMEMHDLHDAQRVSGEGGKVTVHVAQDDDIVEDSAFPERHSLTQADPKSQAPSVARSDHEGAELGASEVASLRSMKSSKPTPKIDPKLTLKAASKPQFVPLPFQVPTSTSPDDRDDDASSVATFAASDRLPDRSSKRLSGSSLMRKLSGHSQRRNSKLTPGTSQEALIVPHVEDDRASSIAATLDGVSDKTGSDAASTSSIHKVLVPQEPNGRSPSQDAPTAPQPTSMASPDHQVASGVHREAQIENESPDLVQAPSSAPGQPRTLTDKQPAHDHDPSAAVETSRSADLREPHSVDQTKPTLIASPKIARSSLAQDLPSGASRIEMAYRTNEWAKHLDRADAPEVEDLKVKDSQSSLSTHTKETVAPVNVKALQQTALNAEPAPNATHMSEEMGDRANLPSMNRSNVSSAVTSHHRPQQSPEPSRSNSQGSQPAKHLERTPSQTSLVSSNGSQEDQPRRSLAKLRGSQSALSIPRGFRSSSSPLVTSPLAASPIHEDVEATFPPKFTPSSSHLMSQRDALIRNKPSSTSLLRTNSSTSVYRSGTTTPDASNLILNSPDEDDENITLAQRKSMLQRNPSRTSVVQRTLSSGAVTPAVASRVSLNSYTPEHILSNNPYKTQISNSNPPHAARAHQSQDPAAINSWRSSLAQLPNTAESQQADEMERRRSELLIERQAQKRSSAVQVGQREQRESVLGREMRRGSMLDAHREAMRRMQSQVNESLKPSGAI